MSNFPAGPGMAQLDAMFDELVKTTQLLGDAIYDRVYTGRGLTPVELDPLIKDLSSVLAYLGHVECTIHLNEDTDVPFGWWLSARAVYSDRTADPKET
jgi:hypothetical protein